MKRLVLIVTLIILFSGSNFAAALNLDKYDPGLGFDFGYGGPHGKPSLGAHMTMDDKPNILIVLGLAAIPGERVPKDTADYSCPHYEWYEQGLYTSTEYILTLSIGKYITNNSVAYILGGGSFHRITQVQRSTVTGWTYTGYKDNKFNLSYGGGMRFFFGDTKKDSINIEYNNRRGFTIGYAFDPSEKSWMK